MMNKLIDKLFNLKLDTIYIADKPVTCKRK